MPSCLLAHNAFLFACSLARSLAMLSFLIIRSLPEWLSSLGRTRRSPGQKEVWSGLPTLPTPSRRPGESGAPPESELNGRTNKQINDQRNLRQNEGNNERTNERTKEFTTERRNDQPKQENNKRTNERTKERTNEHTKERTNESTNKRPVKQIKLGSELSTRLVRTE